MKTMRWEPMGIEIPTRWRRWMDLDDGAERWMRIEQFVEDGVLRIRAELPGVDPDEDVEVTVEDGVLRIRAEREARDEHDGRRSEFRYGELSRSLVLPAGVDASAVTASYVDGILELRVPVAEERARPATRVAISHG